MLHSITWQQYFTTIIILLIFYYLIIGVRYFKLELLTILGIKQIESDSLTPYPIGTFPSGEETASPFMQSLLDEISAYLNGTQNSTPSKEELCHSLGIIFSKYPVLSESEFSDHQKIILLEKINQQYPNMLEIEDLNKLCSG